MNGTTEHILWVESETDEYILDLGECPVCGSLNTFVTFDNKLVCRSGWHVTNLEN